jgi:hypothetical protein
MKSTLVLLFVVAGLTMARAQSFTANLDPFQEVPPHNTPAYGSGDFTLLGTTLSVDAGTGLYADLLAGATSVRISDGAVGTNGPTVFLLNLDTPGNTSGTFSGSGTLTASQITDLEAGNLYVNIADSVYPSGEIRGQIEAAPEPSSWALALICVASFACLRRARGLKRIVVPSIGKRP